jgi:hypothetical protein
MGKAQRAHQSQSVPMGKGRKPVLILPKNPVWFSQYFLSKGGTEIFNRTGLITGIS